MAERKVGRGKAAGGVTRRKALKQIGAAVGAAALSPLIHACGTDGEGGASAANRAVPVDHFVLLMMENRSFDHYFGSLSLLEGKQVDGLRPGMANPRPDNSMSGIYRETLRCVADPPHGWVSTHAQVNGGRNDGFVLEHFKRVGAAHGDEVMGYLTRAHLPISYALADEFALCDRWFCAVQGPTWPNRLFLHSAQSNGRTNNDLPVGAGFRFPTIYDQLQAAGVTWKYYYSDLPFLLLYSSLGRLADHIVPVAQYFEDARSGNLPQVSVVEPAFGLNDDHPPHDIRLGQAFISSVVHALGQSPHWRRSMFLLTYDEHGGFFDHVAPPKVQDERASEGFDDAGVRVPGLVISPWAKRGYVSSVVHEHSSWPALLERKFNLAPMTLRDANANSFDDVFDFDRINRDDPRPFPNLPMVTADPNIPPECAAFGAGGAAALDIEIAADAGLVPRQFDRRKQLPETLRTISDELVRMGAGELPR